MFISDDKHSEIMPHPLYDNSKNEMELLALEMDRTFYLDESWKVTDSVCFILVSFYKEPKETSLPYGSCNAVGSWLLSWNGLNFLAG